MPLPRAAKVAALAVLAWAGVVAAFETAIGVLQPASGPVLLLTTFDRDGAAHDRVVSRLESGGRLYVAANHWPRAWYRRALENPEVEVTLEGERRGQRAVPVAGAERDGVDAEHPLPVFFRILTGFPPRHFVRLDPR